jgi:hypothetical protein
MFWVISAYVNIRNTLPKSGTFLLGHLVYNKARFTGKKKYVYFRSDVKTKNSGQNMKM